MSNFRSRRRVSRTIQLFHFLLMAPCGPILAQSPYEIPFQPSVEPLGAPILNPTYQGRADYLARDFADDHLPRFSSLTGQVNSRDLEIPGLSLRPLPSDRFVLSVQNPVRAYFVGEDTTLHSSLGFSSQYGGLEQSFTLMPDLSSGFPDRGRSMDEPLVPGDFVDLGRDGLAREAGDSLDLYLVSDGARGGESQLWNQVHRNPDGIDHALAFAVVDSPFLLLLFEETPGGGDRDYNDVAIILDIGRENVQGLPVPAPSPLLLTPLFLVAANRHRSPGKA